MVSAVSSGGTTIMAIDGTGLPKRTAQVVTAVVLGGSVVLAAAVKYQDTDRDVSRRIERAVAASEARQSAETAERIARIKLEITLDIERGQRALLKELRKL